MLSRGCTRRRRSPGSAVRVDAASGEKTVTDLMLGATSGPERVASEWIDLVAKPRDELFALGGAILSCSSGR